MKEAELRQHSTCCLCMKPIGASGLPLFWRVPVERFGVNLAAVKRQDGLGAFLGSPALAAVMGPGEDLAKPVMEPVTATICETCVVRSAVPIAVLASE